MQNLKKSTSRTKNPAIENLVGMTISVFFLSILIITCVLVIIFVIFGDYQKSAWQNLIKEHTERYPAMQPADVYKLVYQGTFGPAHLGVDSTRLLISLQNELATLEADSNIEEFEVVSPSQKYIRINLKYMKFLQSDPKLLVSAIQKSSPIRVDSNLFARRWKWVEQMISDGKLPFEPQTFQAFSDSVKKAGYPVIHHSEQYMQKYQPAYRVINRRYLNFTGN